MSNLRDLAKDATPGPWSRSGVRRKFEGADSHMVYATVDGKEIGIAAVWFDPRTGDGFTDAAYIAAANPTAILALYAERDEADRAICEVMGRLGYATGHGDTLTDLLGELEWQARETLERMREAESALSAARARVEELEGALEVTRKLVADAAASGFTEIGPLELLYAHQAELTRTLLKETDRG